MARPIVLELPPRDPQSELNSRLHHAPEQHAEAVIAAYEVLQSLHDSGVLELLRGTLGGSEKTLEQVVDVARGPESIRAMRNLLLLTRALGEIDPALLSGLTSALPEALVQARSKSEKPPGLFKLIGTFWNRDFRRGLAVFNGLLMIFGRNLRERGFRQDLQD